MVAHAQRSVLKVLVDLPQCFYCAADVLLAAICFQINRVRGYIHVVAVLSTVLPRAQTKPCILSRLMMLN